MSSSVMDVDGAPAAAAAAAGSFNACMLQGVIFKKIIDSIKDLVVDANFHVSAEGIHAQAMDSSHVALISLTLNASGFDTFECSVPQALGINMNSLQKVLKCGGAEDVLTLSSEVGGDQLNFIFEAPNQRRTAKFHLKLMDIDSQDLGIPDTKYSATITMGSHEFQRIMREINNLGDTVTVSATKDGVVFAIPNSDISTCAIHLKSTEAAQASSSAASVLMDAAAAAGAGKGEIPVIIKHTSDVNASFSLRYFNFFAKASTLSDTVTLKLSEDVPIVVEYCMPEYGHLRFYLAPKIEED